MGMVEMVHRGEDEGFRHDNRVNGSIRTSSTVTQEGKVTRGRRYGRDSQGMRLWECDRGRKEGFNHSGTRGVGKTYGRSALV